MLKKIAFALLALVVLFVVVVAMQPSSFRVERSTKIAASDATVFAEVNDFHKWDAWSPWAKLDPNAKNTFEGKPEGEGAVFRWSGNNDVGEGSMTITTSEPSRLIRIRLDFVKPFEDTANVEFTFQPAGDETLVTWSMAGKSNFVGKAFCLFMSMDKMIGEQYEKGLASLKKIAEAK